MDIMEVNSTNNEAECTRLYVQNLPSYVDTDRLRAHFATQGEVTDACVIRTKDGRKSRRFGFIGYKTSQTAKRALKFFHQTYLDTCKLNVRLAQTRESNEITRPWSKYTAGSSRYQQTINEKSLEDDNNSPVVENTSKDNKPGVENNIDFNEFMNTMQKRSQSKFWANDDVINEEVASGTIKEDNKNESDDEDIVNDTEALQLEKKKKVSQMSDLEFLRTKMSSKQGHTDESEDHSSDDESINGNKPDTSGDDKKEKIKSLGLEDKQVNSRLFVRNLPFSAMEEELTQVFSKYGEITEVHLPLDDSRRAKGYGYVQFSNTVDAERALNQLNGVAFQGRPLHLLFANEKPKDKDPAAALNDPNLTYKQKKEMERQLQAQSKTGWNASYIRGDATVGSLAERMGVKKGDIMDRDVGSMAVRLAIGETLLVKENKDFFAKEGVDLEAIEGAILKNNTSQKHKGSDTIQRSTNVILIKNLPHTTDENELAQLFRKHGEICRFLLPPSKTIALVEFLEPSEARKAFRAIAYKKYQHVPLYLEWAPLKVFTSRGNTTGKANENDPTSHPDTVELNESNTGVLGKGIKSLDTVAGRIIDEETGENDTSNDGDAHTLCVKNLSFSTKENQLEALFQPFGKLRKVTIARRKDPKRGMLSMGFGFVEFYDVKSSQIALEKLQGKVLEGHALNIRISQKKLVQPPKRKGEIDRGNNTNRQTKIIVRNVAFEATSNEIRELFGAFGQLKRVRMPKKFDGKHRGFAFVEFLTEQEALNAFASLSKSHLYGRHLVLEWAEDMDDLETLRAKASSDLAAIHQSDRRKRMKRSQDQEQEDFE